MPPDIQLNTDLKCTYWRHSDISLQFYIFRISKFNSCVHQSSVLVVSFRVSSFISVIRVVVKLHSYCQSQLQFPGGLNPSNVNIQCSCSLKVLICFYFQDVVYALAHATGKTGRFTLIERWRNNERLLAPQEHPLKVNITKYFFTDTRIPSTFIRPGAAGDMNTRTFCQNRPSGAQEAGGDTCSTCKLLFCSRRPRFLFRKSTFFPINFRS